METSQKLVQGIIHDDIESVRLAIHENADIDYGCSLPLLHAIGYNRTEILDSLLRCNVKVIGVQWEICGFTPVTYAVYNVMQKICLKDFNIRVITCAMDVLRMVLRAGGDPNMPRRDGISAIETVILMGADPDPGADLARVKTWSLEVAQLLHMHGARITEREITRAQEDGFMEMNKFLADRV